MSQQADLIIDNGKVITLTGNGTVHESIAVKDGEILQSGTKEQISVYRGSETEVIDVKWNSVVPGFIDGHVHFMQTGLNELFLDYTDFYSMNEMLEDLRQLVVKADPGEWIYVAKFDDDKFSEKRAPTIDELDRIAPENPIWLNRVDCHSCVVNSRALQELALDSEELMGAERGNDGKFNGNMKTVTNGIVRKRVMDQIPLEQRQQAIELATKIALEAGITTVHSMEGGKLFSDKDVDILLEKWQENPLYIVVFNQTTDVERVADLGLDRIGGCVILDGSFGSRSAALLEPYTDDNSTRGQLYYTQEEIDDFVLKAHRRGMQITVHAIGDRAIEQILQAYEKAQQKYPRPGIRHRIEHAELVNREQLQRCAKLGVSLSVQPTFEHYWGGPGMYGSRLGSERVKTTNPYRNILDSGCLLVGGSDSDVTPMDPLLGIHGAINHSNQEQQLSVMEALKLFTINAAKSVHEEDLKGTIESGKLANLTILDGDLLSTDTDKIKELSVIKTLIDGEIYYSKDSS